jgi:hypothetical protein
MFQHAHVQFNGGNTSVKVVCKVQARAHYDHTCDACYKLQASTACTNAVQRAGITSMGVLYRAVIAISSSNSSSSSGSSSLPDSIKDA